MHNTDSIGGIAGGTGLFLLLAKYFGPEMSDVIFITLGALCGAYVGIAWRETSIKQAVWAIPASVAASFVATFAVSRYVAIPAYATAMVIAAVMVSPKANFYELLGLLDRIRGKKEDAK